MQPFFRSPAFLACLLGLGLVASLGCRSMTPYTTNTSRELNLPLEALREVQYYLGSPLTLEAAGLRSVSFIISGHRVRNDQEEYAERILLKRNTPVVAETISAGHVVVSAAEDLILGFRPDSTLSVLLDSVAAAHDSIRAAVQAGLLPREAADSLLVSPVDTLSQPVPFTLATINGVPVQADTTIRFRDDTFVVRYGYYDRGDKLVYRGPPQLVFHRKLFKQRTRDVEILEGRVVTTTRSGSSR